MNKRDFNKNVKYLEKNSITFCGQPWDDLKWSAELESYTDAGGDMLICLKELNKECLRDYLDNFDIDDEIMAWWGNSTPATRSASGLPFDNIREHYNDLESWVEWMKEVCDGMPC